MTVETVLLSIAMFLPIICNGMIKIVIPPILIFANAEDGNKSLGNEASKFCFFKVVWEKGYDIDQGRGFCTMASEINKSIQEYHPAAWKALTELGKRIYLPKGIPLQAQQAAKCDINATIGQCTDDVGAPMPLPIMADKFQNLDPKDVFLYTSQGGRGSSCGLERAYFR